MVIFFYYRMFTSNSRDHLERSDWQLADQLFTVSTLIMVTVSALLLTYKNRSYKIILFHCEKNEQFVPF